ncbi:MULTISPECIES: histidinol dehydrogenase [Desulfococcus]|jgi:histidinol dehydrogenase|uniref:Histidinol dehydrogenase n=1 Tax=Desulfococcus multivorans DSM 2059 TaxID=1121405 RepID=S7U0B3_DESML|nr:histidinol dehydrogenase [Desulfococcus multivorans]AOY59436.1 HisD: histidinol dehydrogenase [Desulfococcus multivorans]AQV01641.1 histidinol dehydrogenase [Desulfococcus multivorans]EPR42856.1 Histidinol dehydrogenase [Desulfococcus multivorans DSM 2059]MDX9817684.1 histidinol dehydrogenase [Desulfococcus multivorans]SKA00744.1 histidinol dehydrogenase [Desulfococcus multivorans DSM 2059]
MEIYTYPSNAATGRLKAIAGRGVAFDEALFENVKTILKDVASRGDAALVDYANRFDAPDLTAADLEVTPAEFSAAESVVEGSFMAAMERAAEQIEGFHRKQLRKSWITTDRPGTLLGQIFNPVETAGVYVPGGTGGDTPLVSTVLMNAIPARIAGVNRIIMVTPSRRDGTVNPYMLAAARRVGVDAVFRVGSAWAIGALAYGTERIPRCDVIVGPGNIYVTIAKKIVSGTVGIDMIAGPSEVLVIADDSANPEFTAADLLSQAEHDTLASAVLVTTSRPLAEAVVAAVTRQTAHLTRKDIARKSLENYGAVFVVSDIPAAFELANRIAPEHLELHIEAPFEHLGRIRNAGAVFVGQFTPEPIGDYIAGPNHVLPTAGTARFSSALSVDNFIKKTSLISYSETAFLEDAPDVIRLAETEGLGAHAHSVRIRLGQ